MGITGLLPFVKKASRPCFLHEFSGQVAAVDTYCWLHKGAFSCAEKLVRGEETDGYVVYVMKMVRLLMSHKIKPVMVFDGCNLPSKAGTEAKRRESRAKNRALAKEMLREGKVREARECFQRCVDVTSHMARAVMKACREINVDVIVAPYEADAQLAYLALEGFADLVITEDSDLLLFGCEKVLFKLDSHGGGVLVEQQKLHLALGLPPDKFSLELFRNVGILSGCDYLPSLPGIGLTKASKFFSLTSNTDVYNVLCKLPSYLKMPQLEVTTDYRSNFVHAVNTFLYQLVFCPRDRILRPLVQYRDGSDWSDHPYAGAHIGHDKALAIALGNIDLQSGQVVDNFDPDRHKARPMKSSCWDKSGDLVAESLSIWDPAYDKTKVHARNRPNPKSDARQENKLSAFAVNETKKRTKPDKLEDSVNRKIPPKAMKPVKVLDIKTLFAKRKREDTKTEVGVTSAATNELLALYGCERKSPKKMRVSKSSASEPPDQSAAADSIEGDDPPPKRESVFNPFAKKSVKTDVETVSPVKSSSVNPCAETAPDSDASLGKISSETISGYDPCATKPTTIDIPIHELSPEKGTGSETNKQDSLEAASGISPTLSPENAVQNYCASPSTSAFSLIATDQQNEKVRAVNLAHKNEKTRIIMKSRYFRPVGDSPGRGLRLSQTPLERNSGGSGGDSNCLGRASGHPAKPGCVEVSSPGFDARTHPQSGNSSEPTDAESTKQDELKLTNSENFTKSQSQFNSEGCVEKFQRTSVLSEFVKGIESSENGKRKLNENLKFQDPAESVLMKRFTLSQEGISNLSQKDSEMATSSQESPTFGCSFNDESFGFTPLSRSASELSQGSSLTNQRSSQYSDDDEDDNKKIESLSGTSLDQFSKSQMTMSSSTKDNCKMNSLSCLEGKNNVKLKPIRSDESKLSTAVDPAADWNSNDSHLISQASSDGFLSAFDRGINPPGRSKQSPSVVGSSLRSDSPRDSGFSTLLLSESPTPSEREAPTVSGNETPTPERDALTVSGLETSTPSAIDSRLPFCAVSLASSPSESPRPCAEPYRSCTSETATHNLSETPVPSSPTSSVFLRRSMATSTSQVLAPIENTTGTSAASSAASDKNSSPYFSTSISSSKLSGCRKPGLPRPPSRGTNTNARGKKWRQLDLRDMFAARR